MEDSAKKIEMRAPRGRSLTERLEEHPELRQRFEMILDIVENTGGDVEKANEAERRAIEAVRQLGNEIVHGWAQRQHQKKETEFERRPDVNRKEKKTSIGSRSSERSK